jgi:hypothetical protein
MMNLQAGALTSRREAILSVIHLELTSRVDEYRSLVLVCVSTLVLDGSLRHRTVLGRVGR